jgi:hypothetical protein
VEQETVDVITCIGRMVQHTMPKGFKRIRDDGVQATKTFAKVKVLIREALAKVVAGDAEETGDRSHTKDMRGDQTQDVAFEVIQSGLSLPWQ